MGKTLSANSQRHPSYVGIDPVPHVFLMENHDEALQIWRKAGVSQRVLVHVDAHHDMWWIGDKATITIANFICPALKQNLIREVIWVAPDETFENQRNRKPFFRHLKRILKEYPATSRSMTIEDHQISASVLGKKLTVCPLRSIPALGENVLLDIDVDYLMIPRVVYGESDQHALLPWRWPSELLEGLRGIQSDLATVAYSVEGGYTPLKWRHLGDEVVLRLKKPGGDGSDLQGMDRMREGAEAELRGDTARSESQYRLAMELQPYSAAPPYRLARLLGSSGRLEEGRQLYRQAGALNGAYGGPYSSTGFHYFWRRQFETAKQEFCEIQALDPEDEYAHLGLGLLAKEQKRWKAAEQSLRAALARDDCLVDAQRSLGDVLLRQHKKQEAIAAYERALKLGLMGYSPLSGPIVTHPQGRLLDPWHCDTHARLAALYEETGATTKALNALRIAVAGDFENVAFRFRLGRLYARERQWGKSAGEVWKAVKGSPQGVARGCMRLRWRLKGMFEGGQAWL